jgi:DNA-binding transcriptional regulator YhcF (GntR family)
MPLHLYHCINTIESQEGERVFHTRPQSGEPIYEQLVRQVKHAITTGALKSGAQMPTVRELAAELVINPNTVARAYRELEQAGLLESTVGRGTFVKFSPPRIFREERRKRLQPYIDQLIAEARVLNFTMKELQEQIEETLKKVPKG